MNAASNTRECFREVVGRTVIGVLFDALPLSRADLARGTKTLIFDDGSGLTIASNGSYWQETAEDVERAISRERKRLEDAQQNIAAVLELAGAKP